MAPFASSHLTLLPPKHVTHTDFEIDFFDFLHPSSVCYSIINIKPRKSLQYIKTLVLAQLTEKTNLHFRVLALELKLNLHVSCGRYTLHGIQAIFHLMIVGQYVRALPMNLIPVGDQVHGVLAPTGICNGTS